MAKVSPPRPSAPPLGELLGTVRKLLEQGRTLEVIERFYAEDVCVFENRELARAGRERCLAYERAALERQPRLPEIRVRNAAADEATGTTFVEQVVRFVDPEGRPMRLEEVAVQKWHAGKITEERFYYEGVVDEGD